MNAYHLSVPCPYCRAGRHQPCRNTMSLIPLKANDVHQARIESAEGTEF